MRKIKAIEKKERALGAKLFLKAERCSSPKCVTVRRPYRPGLHGQKRYSLSEYGKQLREKQKIQISYGLNSRQMQNLFKKKKPDEIIKILETRLDRVLFLLGLAGSMRIARQLVSHGHITVNGRRVTIPSCRVRISDVVAIRPGSIRMKVFEDLRTKLKQYEPPSWLTLDKEKLEGKCLAEPDASNIVLPFDINLVVQFYSR